MIPKLSYSSIFVFDLDKTLALSKQSIDETMSSLLALLLAQTNVAVVSGGKFEQLEQQVADRLPTDASLEHLYILPTSGAALYTFKGSWKKIYEEHISDDEAKQVEDAIEQAVLESGLVTATTPSYGERIEYRGAEVTFSALGQQAPLDEKQAWDPDGAKKRAIQELIVKRLPGFDVKVGGSTSIDITKRGVNKAFGIRKLSEYTEIPISEMLYVGDALGAGGNDEVVKETGIETHAVKDVEDTKSFIQNLLAQ